MQAGLLSRERGRKSERRRCSNVRKATPKNVKSRALIGFCAVEDPWHAWKLHAREPGGPVNARHALVKGRLEKDMIQKSNMHVDGKSDGRAVLTKCLNKSGNPLAEGAEGSRPTKENTEQTTASQTQSWGDALSGLRGVREAAKRDKRLRFTALLHHVSVSLLESSFYALKRDAAPGVDGVTWTEYETGLSERLKDLHSRVHQGTYRAQPSKRAYIPKADGRKLR
jgi:RNA-directed DNA polymerase